MDLRVIAQINFLYRIIHALYIYIYMYIIIHMYNYIYTYHTISNMIVYRVPPKLMVESPAFLAIPSLAISLHPPWLSAGCFFYMDMDYIPMIYMVGFHNTPSIPMIDCCWLYHCNLMKYVYSHDLIGSKLA